MPSPAAPDAPPLALPELDKADDDSRDEVDVGVFDLDVGEGLVVADDDATLDSFEIDIQEQDDPGSNEAASELDIGESQLLDALPEPPPALEGDDRPETDGELDRHLDAPLEADDPSTDAELGDDGLEALPELTPDDPDSDAGLEVDRALLPGAPEGAIPAGPSFEVEWLSLGAPCFALCATEAALYAIGERVMHFTGERRDIPLPAGTRARSLAELDGGVLVLATVRGSLELTPAGALSAIELPEGLRGSGSEVRELVGAPASRWLWARFEGGGLYTWRGRVWARHEAGGRVQSLSCAERSITLLVLGKRPTLQLSSDGGSSFRELLLPEPAATVALGAEPAALAAGSTQALWDAERGLCVSSDGGASFRLVTGAVNVTAVTIALRAGKPVVFAALYREGRDVSELIMVDPVSGAACSVAELSGADGDDSEEMGRSFALRFAPGFLWAAGSYGLARLRVTE